MKHALLSLLLFTVVVYSFQACKKEPSHTPPATDEKLIESAKQFFEGSINKSVTQASGNYRIDAAKKPNWTSAKVHQFSTGPAIVVPIQYIEPLSIKTTLGGSKLFNLNDLAHLVIYKDKRGTYQVQVITFLPDSVALKPGYRDFTGILFVESWRGQRLRQLKFNTGGAILTYNAQDSTHLNKSIISTVAPSKIAPSTFIVTCDEIDGYNYSPAYPEDGYAWTESAGCSTWYIDMSGGTGDFESPSNADYGSIGGAGATSTPAEINVSHGPNFIGNIQDYLKCFTNGEGADHNYNVTVCVDQPIPGTRQAWGFQDGASGSSAANNIFDVGHTFLIFSETYGGNTIVRNVGFYPKTVVNPLYPSDQGQLNDNEASIYNISLTINITNTQFFNMLSYVSQGNNPGFMYNLNNNNCTTFALMALQAGFVNLTSQMGSWAVGAGYGYDPGDLGEDIRNMQLDANMTRNTLENSHPNIGNCY
jgi:hypothetical protein